MKVDRVCIGGEPAARAADLGPALEELGLAADILPVGDMARAAADRYALLWLVAGPDPHPAALDPALQDIVRKFLAAGRGVYAEFVAGFPFLAPEWTLRSTGPARLIIAEEFGGDDALAAGTILDAHQAVTMEVQPGSARVLADLGHAVGVNRALARFGTPWPGIIEGHEAGGRWAWCSFRMSDFGRRQFSPQASWRLLVRDLARRLLPADVRARVDARRIPVRAFTEPRRWAVPGDVHLVVETAPGASVTGKGLAFAEQRPGRFVAEVRRGSPGASRLAAQVSRGGRSRRLQVPLRVEDRPAAYRRALDRNIAWFEKSGALIAPDGSLGVYEWISGPDSEGNRIPYGKGQMFAPVRADCVFESGLAFLRYGAVTGDTRRRAIGRNLLTRVLDFQRLGAGDEHGGLWYTRGRAGPPYEDDEAWAVICALAAYRDTGERMFLERGMLGARATLRVYGAGSPQAAEANDPANEHPSARGQMYAAWLYTYGVTGDRQYLDLALPGLRAMCESFRRVQLISVSRTNEASRWLLPLALAFAYSGEKRFADELAVTAAYLRSRRAPCGAIQEECRSQTEKFDGNDLGLVHDNTETVSDQLYTTSWAAMSLWIAWRATKDTAYREDFEILTDYLVRIQDASGDPRVDGGWTRGFDYGHWESHGSNADHAWSAWCMETGWGNAVIDLALTLFLGGDTFYEERRP